jgi:hypothetical protein
MQQWLMDGAMSSSQTPTGPSYLGEHIRAQILDVVEGWLQDGNARSDFLDNLDLHDALIAFLSAATVDFRERRSDLLTRYLDLTMRPLPPASPPAQAISTVDEGNEQRFGPVNSAKDLVQNLDTVGWTTLQDVSRRVSTNKILRD